MYILYRYFKGLKLRGIYEKIADLVNGASFHFFKAGTGMSLEPDNVRKRIQWAKKQEAICEYVMRYEDEWKKQADNNKTSEGGD